jgi:PAS domain S-box-containing protein
VINRSLLIALLVAINIIVGIALTLNAQKAQQEAIDDYMLEMKELYDGAAETFRLNALNTFDSIIMRPDVLAILRQLPGASAETVDRLHNELHALLQAPYEKLSAHINTRQIHFHHTDGRSFLRMHRPSKYGDPLFDVRHSVYLANTTKKFTEGFEEGRIYNGYRYVFPLLDGDSHYGSVEVSFAMCAFMKWFATLKPDNGFYFMLNKQVIDQKVFASEKSNYQTSRLFETYAEDKESCLALGKRYSHFFEHFTPTDAQIRLIDDGKPFILPFSPNTEDMVLTFLPIKNLKGEQVAYVVRFDDGSWLGAQKSKLFYRLALMAALSLLFYFFSDTLMRRKEHAEAEKERLKKLLDELATLRAVVEAAPVSMVISDPDGFIQYVNPRFSELTGYTYDEALGHNPNILKSGWTTDEEYVQLWETITSGKIWSGTFKNLKKSGEEYWEHAVIAPVLDGSGKITHYLGIKQEITEEVHLRQRLLAKDVELKTLATLVESSTTEIYIFDQDTLEFIYANASALANTGYTLETFRQLSPWELKGLEKSAFLTLIAPLAENKVEHLTFTGVHCRNDGSRYPVEVRLQKSLFDETQAYTAMITDMTEKNKLNEELSQMNDLMMIQSRYAAMGEMIGLLAHQWRQPIAIIEMGINNLLIDLELDMGDKETMVASLKKLATYTQELSEMISDFRSHFKTHAEGEPYTIDGIVTEVFDIMESSLAYHSITLEKEMTCEKTLIRHKDEMFQAVLTLLTNAKEVLIERQVTEPRINVTASCDDTRLKFCVSDNAGGVDDAHIDKIFEPYYSTKESLNQSGLGLYVTKLVIQKKFGGDVTIANAGDGACFTVTIPLQHVEQ